MNEHIDQGEGFTHHDDTDCCPCPCKQTTTPSKNEELREIRSKLLAAYAEPNDKLEYNGNNSTRHTDELMHLIDQYADRQKDEIEAVTYLRACNDFKEYGEERAYEIADKLIAAHKSGKEK